MLLSKKKIKILFASRLVLEKGVDIMIGAIDKSMQDKQLGPYLDWHICSDGLYEEAIHELTMRYPDNVHYYGKVPATRLCELYREADFLLMPSRFLEAFGLTALESLACGTPIIGWKKGGLDVFIPDELAINPLEPVDSLLEILGKYIHQDIPDPIDISGYDQHFWIDRVSQIFGGKEQILLVHDYDDLIGGAEYYIETVKTSFSSLGKGVLFFGYHGKTTPWKRRIMFIVSLFAFWRGIRLRKILEQNQPDAIWMHSVLRYVGIWGVREVARYTRGRNVSVFLSHHDVGLIAPFPQYITEENQIPNNASLLAFIPQELSLVRMIVSIFKWGYVMLLKSVLPDNTKHIIFSSFLEKNIRAHFPNQEILLLPHSFDKEVFYP